MLQYGLIARILRRRAGTKAFVESLFEAQRWRFAVVRKEDARIPHGGDGVWQGLRILRAPRLRAPV